MIQVVLVQALQLFHFTNLHTPYMEKPLLTKPGFQMNPFFTYAIGFAMWELSTNESGSTDRDHTLLFHISM